MPYFLSNRDELKDYDTAGDRLMEKVRGKPKKMAGAVPNGAKP